MDDYYTAFELNESSKSESFWIIMVMMMRMKTVGK